MSDPLDVARHIFVNEESELRSGWRVLAFLVLFGLAATLLTGLISVLVMLFPSVGPWIRTSASDELSKYSLVRLTVDNLTNLFAVLIATVLCAGGLERRDLGSVGFRLHPGWFRDFGLGSLLGAASIAIAIGVAACAGAVIFELQTREVIKLAGSCLIVFVFFVLSGVTEELIFRGFAFQALVHNLGGSVAIAVTSILFGLAHV